MNCVDFLIDNGGKMDVVDNMGVSLLRMTNRNVFASGLQAKISRTMAFQAESEQNNEASHGTYKTCAVCKPEVNNKRCGGCHIKWYCSVRCQSKDWKNHQAICMKIRNEYEELDKEEEEDMVKLCANGNHNNKHVEAKRIKLDN